MEGFEDLSIDIDADDYAEAAAGDIPSVARTFQSEEQFKAVKASYHAKHDAGTSYDDLIKQLADIKQTTPAGERGKLDKRQQLLLGYAVGELYYDKQYKKILELCETIQTQCHTDKKLDTSISRWITKCNEKLR